MLSDSLVEQFRVRLAALGLELADLRIGGTPNRPLAQVRIEWPPADPGTPERRGAGAGWARARPPPYARRAGGGTPGPPYMIAGAGPRGSRARPWLPRTGEVVGGGVGAATGA